MEIFCAWNCKKRLKDSRWTMLGARGRILHNVLRNPKKKKSELTVLPGIRKVSMTE
jgi:hypothetical protein